MTLLLAVCAFTLTSCDDTQQATETPIQVGAENDNSIEVSPQATRILLLSGGTGKYSAYVADSKIASVSLSKDTLRINGILEGKTYAVSQFASSVHTHEFRMTGINWILEATKGCV